MGVLSIQPAPAARAGNRGVTPNTRYAVPDGCTAPTCNRGGCNNVSLELRHSTQRGSGGILWVCPNRPSCYHSRKCTRAVQEAFAAQGPVSPCVICLAECDQGTAFQWPCHHGYHNDCVARLYARTPRPPCPLCRTAWSDDTERRFRSTCTLGNALDLGNDRGIAHRLPPERPDQCFGTCACTQPPTPMSWAPRAVNMRSAQVEWVPEWICPRCRGTAPAAPAAAENISNCDSCGYNRWLITERSTDESQSRYGCLQCEASACSWYSHDFTHFPPTNITGSTYSWLYMPLIYAALDLPRHPSWRFDAAELPEHWEDWVAEYRVAFRQAGITEEWIRRPGIMDGPAHIKAEHQEFLINLRVAEHNNPDGAPFAMAGNHVIVYGAYASAAARNGVPEQARRRRPAPSSAADPIRDQVTRRSAAG